MKMNGLSIVQQDWIGMEVRVISAKNKAYLGMVGCVIDETKHLFVIETSNKIVRVPKTGCVFQISFNGRKFNVTGDILEMSPEERLKLKV